VAGVDYPRNWQEFLERFADEAACLGYLERLRWGDGFVCPHCGVVGGEWWRMGDGLHRCRACRRETSVTAGTILAGTRLPLRTWFAAVWYVVNQKQGVSALGLQRVLGFGSYQTAWAWLHKLRRAMVVNDRLPLAGIVEVDETVIGGLRSGRRGRGAAGKTLVAIAVETPAPRRIGRIRMARIADASKDSLEPFVTDHIAYESEIHTDGWAGYIGLSKLHYQHLATSINASGDPAHIALPQVHRVASLLKRWLLGTHQGAISDAQIDYYLDEFVFRFNRRNARSRGLLFYRLLHSAMRTEPVPYRALAASPEG
jgi:transposase-like protein